MLNRQDFPFQVYGPDGILFPLSIELNHGYLDGTSYGQLSGIRPD